VIRKSEAPRHPDEGQGAEYEAESDAGEEMM
jgi:hypothetical protein